MHYKFIGDHSVLIDFSESLKPLEEIHQLSKYLHANRPIWALDIIPGLDSLVIRLNYPIEEPIIKRNTAVQELKKIYESFVEQYKVVEQNNKLHSLQVCYHPDVALDITAIAKACNLSITEIINLHKNAIYTVDLIGFMPGFAYCSGLHFNLKLPRLASPRAMVPKGSVAIAELQTAIYPSNTQGDGILLGNLQISFLTQSRILQVFLGREINL
jgi:KipI family sensor histidine kinase inhibitor